MRELVGNNAIVHNKDGTIVVRSEAPWRENIYYVFSRHFVGVKSATTLEEALKKAKGKF